jgi:hypothetical protein
MAFVKAAPAPSAGTLTGFEALLKAVSALF